jgi:hypothetical protein
MMQIMDGGTSKRDVYFLKNKKSLMTLDAFKEWVARAERQTGKKVKHVRFDGGGEFEGEWKPWCLANRIIWEVTPSYTSQNNGAAERGIHTIIEWTRCRLRDAGLHHKYWAKVTATMVYLMNYIPSARHPEKSPFELWSEVQPNVAHLRAFGCDAYMKIPIIHMDGKLSEQSTKLCLISYHGAGAWRLLDRATGKFYKSRDVFFEEGIAHRTRATAQPLSDHSDLPFDGESIVMPILPPVIPVVTPPTPPALPPPALAPEPNPQPAPPVIAPALLIAVPAPPIVPQLRRSTRKKVASRTAKDAENTEADIQQAEQEGRAWADDGLLPAEDKGLSPRREHSSCLSILTICGYPNHMPRQ